MVDLAPSLALSIRSAREAQRGWLIWLLRAGLFAALLPAVVYVQASALWSGGAILFAVLVWADFLLLSVLAIAAVSQLIAEERERHTLDLLRLAGLSPWSILGGKTSGVALECLALFLLQLPFYLLAITMGGVRLQQIASVLLALLAHAAMMCGIGLFASVVARTSRDAAERTARIAVAYYLLPLLVLIAGAPGWGGWAGQTDWAGWAHAAASSWLQNSPTYVLGIATSSRGSFTTLSIAPAVIAGLSVGVVFLLLARYFFERVRPREESARQLPRAAEQGVATAGGATGIRGDPLRWKDFRFSSGGWKKILWRTVGFGSLVLCIHLALHYHLPSREAATAQLGILLFTIGAIGLVFVGGGQLEVFLREEVVARTWPLLYILPRSLGSTIGAKLAGASCAVLPSLALVAIGLAIPSKFSASVLELVPSLVSVYVIGGLVTAGYVLVYLSLRLSSGGARILGGLALIALYNVVAGTVMVVQLMLSPALAAVWFVMLALLICIVAHQQIVRLLREAAAQG